MSISISSNIIPSPFLAGGYGCQNTMQSCMSTNIHGCCVPYLGNIVLSQQWLINQPTHKFTLHGLWPSDCISNMGPPRGCDDNRAYNNVQQIITLNPTLHQQLTKVFPSEYWQNHHFWQYQWRKHGTCLSTIHPMCYNESPGNDVIKYFTMAVNLYKKFDIKRQLMNNGVVPRLQPYQRNQIFTALNVWSNHISLHCTLNNQLKEIRIYLSGLTNHQFQPRFNRYKGNCSQTIIWSPQRQALPNLATNQRPVHTPPPMNSGIPLKRLRLQ